MAATEIQPKPRSAFRKVTDISLGVASAGALALNLIPTLNIVGAGLQAGITVVQTGLDYHDEGAKKAAKTLAIGSLMTGLSFIPLLGDVGKAAILAEEGTAAVKTARVAGEVTEAVGGGTATLTKAPSGIFSRIGEKFTTAKKAVGGWTLKNVPGADPAYSYLLGKEAAIKSGTKTLIGKSATATNATKILASDKAQTIATYGGTAAMIGASFLTDTNPGKLARAETYADAKPAATVNQAQANGRQWQEYEKQRQQARGKVATVIS